MAARKNIGAIRQCFVVDAVRIEWIARDLVACHAGLAVLVWIGPGKDRTDPTEVALADVGVAVLAIAQ